MLKLTIRPPGGSVFQTRGLTVVHHWRDLSGSVCAIGYVGANARWMRWPGFAAFRFDTSGWVDAFPEREVESSQILDVYG